LAPADAVAGAGGAGGAGVGGGRGGAGLDPALLAQFGGGRGGAPFPDTAQVAGFPRGYNPRPAESRGVPDSSGSPTAVQRALAEAAAGRGGAGGRGGRAGGGGGGGFGRGNTPTAETGDYRVVLDIAGQKQTSVLRVVKVQPGEVMVMAPKGR
jgi:hypothetical protein